MPIDQNLYVSGVLKRENFELSSHFKDGNLGKLLKMQISTLVTEIEADLFKVCPNLNEVTFEGPRTQPLIFGSECFNDITEGCIIRYNTSDFSANFLDEYTNKSLIYKSLIYLPN